MALLLKRGSGTPTTSGTTWANLANAVDGTPGSQPGTVATWTNAVSSGTGWIQVSGFDFSALTGTTLNSITVSFRYQVNNAGRFAAGPSLQAYSGGSPVGTASTMPLPTSLTFGSLVLTPTLAQLQAPTFGVRFTLTGAASTQSRVFSLDFIDVEANYTAPHVPGRPYVWSGSAWAESIPKRWSGSAWEEVPMKWWDGSQWVLA